MQSKNLGFSAILSRLLGQLNVDRATRHLTLRTKILCSLQRIPFTSLSFYDLRYLHIYSRLRAFVSLSRRLSLILTSSGSLVAIAELPP